MFAERAARYGRWADGTAILARVSELEQHRQVVDRALAETGSGWDAWPQAATDSSLDAAVRLSALLLMLGLTAPRIEQGGGYREFPDPTVDAIDRLRRHKLPWDAATATTALRTVTELEDFDDRRVTVALRGAEQVCAAGLADTALLDALQELSEALDQLAEHTWRVPETQELARRVLVAASPPDMLDLTLVRDGDSWGGPAREAARQAPGETVAPLVRLLGELGARKPSRTWLAGVGSAVAAGPAHDLLRRWLELAADADVVPPRPGATVSGSGGMLFCHGNDDLVRAAVLATRVLGDEGWVPGVLGVLARRGAATSGAPAMTEALALKVASAAVDSLAARGTPADHEVLEQLLEDLSRRDLVRRVGAALGRDEEAARRDEELRRVKAAAVRRKADPGPRQARAAVDALLRAHVTPVLRERGFTGTGRTLRRFHGDRVDLVSLGSSENHLSVTYGTRFDGAHPPDDPYPIGRDGVRSQHLDIRMAEHFTATAEELAHFATRLAEVVVPFLDTLGRYELVVALAEHGAGAPGGALQLEGAPSPVTSGFLGLLALSVGDHERGVRHLQVRVRFEESEAYEPDPEAIAFWRRHLDRARESG